MCEEKPSKTLQLKKKKKEQFFVLSHFLGSRLSRPSGCSRLWALREPGFQLCKQLAECRFPKILNQLYGKHIVTFLSV